MPSGARRGTPGVRQTTHDEVMTRLRPFRLIYRLGTLVAAALPVLAILADGRGGPKFL